MKKLRSRKKKKKSNKTKDLRATEIEQEPNAVLESVASDSKQPQPEIVSKQPELEDESDMRIDIPTSASASKESLSTPSSSRLKNSTDCESSPFSPPSSRSKNSTDYESSPFSTPSSIAKNSTESSPFSPSSSSTYSSSNNKLKFQSYKHAVISPAKDKNKKMSDSPLISPEKKSLISPGVKGKRKLLEPTNNPRIELSDQESWDEAIDQLWALGPIFSDKHNYDGVNEVDYETCFKPVHDLYESAKSYLEKAKGFKSLRMDAEAEKYEKMSNDAKTQAIEQTRIASTTIYLSRQNKRKREQEVDLHGQHRDIALRIIKAYMRFTCLMKSVDDYKVITGHGGGEHGEPVIRTEVTTFLDANDIRWHFEDKEGTVCFRLNGSTKKLKM